MKSMSTKFGFGKVILKKKSKELDQKYGLRCSCLPKCLNDIGSENCDLMPSFFLKNIQAEFSLIKLAED